MTITPKQLDIEASYMQDAYKELELVMIKELSNVLMRSTSVELTELTSKEWIIEKMAQLNMLNMNTIKQLVDENSMHSKEQLKKIILDMGYEVVGDVDKQLSSLTGKQPPEMTEIDNVLNSYFNQQWLDIDNHVNQTLITTNFQSNALVRAYQQVLNDAVTRVIGGTTTADKAIRSAIYNLVENGVSSSFIDKGGNQWSLERYVRMVMKATTHKVYTDLRIKRSTDFGIVTALMSSHAAARRACAPIQGGWVLIVPKSDAPPEYQYLHSIYDFGYGEPSGTQGIHCSHRLYLGIPNITKNNMPEPPTQEEAERNAELVAKQRRMETAIRKAKEKLNVAESIENAEDIAHFNQLIRKRQGALRSYISEHDSLLHRSYPREQVYSS